MNPGLEVLFVLVGGVVGAPSRYLVDRFVSERTDTVFPLETFAINIAGSLILGVLAGLGFAGHEPTALRLGLGTGFCGAFTTFSTWSYETVSLIEDGEIRQAIGNVLLSTVVGLVVAGVGIAIGLAVA